MKIKPLVLNNVQLDNNVFLAPMAGYTDYSYRKLQLNLGVGLTFTELVSAKGLFYGGEGTLELLESSDKEKTAVQIFGSEPEFMKLACENPNLNGFKIVDINMGCPVPKVYKNGEGSALLNDIKKAEQIVKACVKTGKIITVKIRTGLKEGDDVAKEFAIMAEESGASLITIHGRVRESYYSGEVDYKAIERAKNAVKIPVIANGGIFTKQDAEELMEKTGADGVMIARGAISNPLLALEILDKKSELTVKDYVIEHINLVKQRYGDTSASILLRKFMSYYLKGVRYSKEAKIKLNSSTSTQQIIKIISEIL